MKNIVVLVSGGGTNLQALIDAQKSGAITGGRITCVISSNPDAYALTRAKENSIPVKVIAPNGSRAEFNRAMLKALIEEKADLIVLAGFLIILGAEIIEAYQNRIINVHPSLIPAFSGVGYYGIKVHRAVLDAGVKITGATVHFVNEIADGGAIIMQKAVPVLKEDTPEILQRRVMEDAEWELLSRAVSLFCMNKLEISGQKVFIMEE